MGKNRNKKKLALKKETVRQLDTMSEDQLRRAAGGLDFAAKTGLCIINNTIGTIGGTVSLACIRTTTYTFGCEPSGNC
ncbi:MAG TPA: hypothetical protein VMZ28_25430 [Kofleriaceae bacterium]|nr:hypothetical protein [Kofleriaceae bacterium]